MSIDTERTERTVQKAMQRYDSGYCLLVGDAKDEPKVTLEYDQKTKKFNRTPTEDEMEYIVYLAVNEIPMQKENGVVIIDMMNNDAADNVEKPTKMKGLRKCNNCVFRFKPGDAKYPEGMTDTQCKVYDKDVIGPDGAIGKPTGIIYGGDECPYRVTEKQQRDALKGKEPKDDE